MHVIAHGEDPLSVRHLGRQQSDQLCEKVVDLAQRDPLQATDPTQAVLERRERLGGRLTGRAQVEHVGGAVVPV